MENLNQPESLSFVGNAEENWRHFIQRFQVYLIAKEYTKKPDDVKVAILLHVAGDEALKVFNTFNLTMAEADNFEAVIKAFEKYCIPRKNVIGDRFDFYMRNREEGESFEHFVMVLKQMVRKCEFAEEESMIRDRIVLGINNEMLQERLLRVPDLTLQRAMEMCQASELSQKQIKHIKGEMVVESVSKKPINRQEGKGKNWSLAKNEVRCKWCGRSHTPKNCPAYGRQCYKCRQWNHFASECEWQREDRNRYKKINTTETQEEEGIEGWEQEFHIGTVQMGQSAEWNQKVSIKDWGNKSILCKLDTGAEISVLPYKVLEKLGINHNCLKTTKMILVMYGGFKVRPRGTIRLNCQVRGIQSQITFVVVDVSAKPILGLSDCEKLNLIKRIPIETIVKGEGAIKEGVFKGNEQLFQGLGKFPFQYKIRIKSEVEPVVKTPYRVPESLRAKLKLTLQRYEERGIISKVSKPTDWVSNLVIVEKPDKTLRLCLNPVELNKVIKREHYVIPTVEEITHKLSGKAVFTVLDMKDGFLQVELDEESSELCTFNCPEGRYKFNRLPFGLASAPEVFQKFNNRIFGDIEGVQIYFDDLIIAGKDGKEHDKILEEVIERAKKYNVRFNKSKVQLKVPRVKYLGLIFSESGVCPDPGQVEAIEALGEPRNRKELQRILGMANFLAKFIPNMSRTTAPMRELLKTSVTWEWAQKQHDALKELKDKLAKAPVLKLYDPKKALTIQCDSSKDGLGCCLMQEGQPISYASRSLTDSEIHYAQIEKEMLSICFAVKKFHTFIYGKKVIVNNDHKPLESILKKDISKATARLQRMYLKLLKYDLEVIYKPGKLMLVADLLSRSYIQGEEREDPEMLERIHTVEKELPMSKARKEQLQQLTAKDPSMEKIVTYCMEGWPERKEKMEPVIKEYWKIRDQIILKDGILFQGEKIIIPGELRGEMLALLHIGHFGVEKTKARARQILYWPGISREIETLISKCSVCERFRTNNIKEPLMSHPVPELPFEVLGMDICHWAGKDYLTVACYLTKWLEVIELNFKTAQEVITKLKQIFATHGVPRLIVSDNMPFNSHIFRKFGKEWGFEQMTSSPHYPRSNGFAEKMVGITKMLLRKSAYGGDLQRSLMEYRNSPITGLKYTPSQMLMSRLLRSKLPSTTEVLEPRVVDCKQEQREAKQKQKKYYDQHTKSRSPLEAGDSIRIKTGTEWEPGIVVGEAETPRSYIVQNGRGSKLRRNKFHLRKSQNPSPLIKIEEQWEEELEEVGDQKNDVATTEEITDPKQGTKDPVKTRYGRIVKTPLALKDYVT